MFVRQDAHGSKLAHPWGCLYHLSNLLIREINVNIHPFKALIPGPGLTQKVASVPYDVVDTAEAAALAEGNPQSFLHIVRPEIDLPEDTVMYSDAVYEKATENFSRFQQEGTLVRDTETCLYVYRQIMDGHVQRGIVGGCEVNDYEVRILTHEKTRPDKENDRCRHVRDLSAHTGPVFLAYADSPVVDACIADVEAGSPMFDFTADDGIQHTGWRVSDTAGLVAAMGEVERAYVADGHHRSASAVRVGAERRAADANANGSAEYERFMTVLFPASQLKVLAYNRSVHDLNGLDNEGFLNAVREVMTVSEVSDPVPSEQGQICMYVAGCWYVLTWDADEGADPVAALDVSVLQSRVLGPILGVEDPRTSNRIDFVGGIRGTGELESRVQSGRGAVAFSLFPTSMKQLMTVADAGMMMPPKSTWFEPKLRSGLFVHTF